MSQYEGFKKDMIVIGKGFIQTLNQKDKESCEIFLANQEKKTEEMLVEFDFKVQELEGWFSRGRG